MKGYLMTVFVAVIVAVIFVVPAGSRPIPPQTSFENIKVMKGMSDTDIRMEMMAWTEALGTTCNYCHVAGDFPSDTNPKKDIARKMFTMVQTINKDFLGGKAKCVLCHRGAAVPDPNL
jgi:Photosynthetic reaction centre cytochrome C subunit